MQLFSLVYRTCTGRTGCSNSLLHSAGKKVVKTDNAPAAVGPYSQGIRAGKTLYVSGCIGLHPKVRLSADAGGNPLLHYPPSNTALRRLPAAQTGEMVGATVEEQTEQVRRRRHLHGLRYGRKRVASPTATHPSRARARVPASSPGVEWEPASVWAVGGSLLPTLERAEQ